MVRPDAGSRRNGGNGPVPVERFFQFSLLGLVLAGYLAVAGSSYLDLATIVLTGAGILLRALSLSGLIHLDLSERAATFLALAYSAFFPLDYFYLSHEFLPCTIHLVFFLAILKILSARTNRDNLYVAVIAFLELVAAAVLSVNLNFFLCLALFLLFAIATLTSAEIRRSMHRSQTTIARAGPHRFHSRLAMLGAWIALGILALTAGMFFLLPRTADAALSHLISHRIHVPGFSDHVALGEIGEFQNSTRAVMHISIYGNQSMGSSKWRGSVLTDFDGRAWSNPSGPLNPESRVTTLRVINGHVNLGLRSGQQRSYQVQMDDLESPVLFFGGAPEEISDLATDVLRQTRTGCFRLSQLPPSGFRYFVFSALEEPPETAPPAYPPPILDLDQREIYLALPSDTDPRIHPLARSMVASAANDLERARALERQLRADYAYTLELPKREPADPLADFLFTRRKGNCEYFASAMAVMLRSIGVPARLATGFQTGVYNSISDLWVVRASDAHSWVEAWIPGHGWTTFDPTPPDYSSHGISLLSRADLYLDAAQTFWRQWVVGYDPGHQGSLAERAQRAARRLGIGWFDSLSEVPASPWVARTKMWGQKYGVRVVLLLALGYLLWIGAPPLIRSFQMRQRVERVRRGHVSVADATLLYERMLQVLKRQGYQKPIWFTPAEFARSLPPTPVGRRVQEFTAAYNALRFGGQLDAAPQLSTLLQELERSGA